MRLLLSAVTPSLDKVDVVSADETVGIVPNLTEEQSDLESQSGNDFASEEVTSLLTDSVDLSYMTLRPVLYVYEDTPLDGSYGGVALQLIEISSAVYDQSGVLTSGPVLEDVLSGSQYLLPAELTIKSERDLTGMFQYFGISDYRMEAEGSWVVLVNPDEGIGFLHRAVSLTYYDDIQAYRLSGGETLTDVFSSTDIRVEVVFPAADHATGRDFTLVLPDALAGIYYETVTIGSDGSLNVVLPSVVEEHSLVAASVDADSVEAVITTDFESNVMDSSDFDQWYSSNRDTILAAWSNAISGLDLNNSEVDQTAALSQLWNETLRSLYGAELPWDGDTVVETDIVVTEDTLLAVETVDDFVVDSDYDAPSVSYEGGLADSYRAGGDVTFILRGIDETGVAGIGVFVLGPNGSLVDDQTVGWIDASDTFLTSGTPQDGIYAVKIKLAATAIPGDYKFLLGYADTIGNRAWNEASYPSINVVVAADNGLDSTSGILARDGSAGNDFTEVRQQDIDLVVSDAMVTADTGLTDKAVGYFVSEEVTNLWASLPDGEVTADYETTVTAGRDFDQRMPPVASRPVEVVTISPDLDQWYFSYGEALDKVRVIAINEEIIENFEQVEEQVDVEPYSTASLSFGRPVAFVPSLNIMSEIDVAMYRIPQFGFGSELLVESELTGASADLSNEPDQTSLFESGVHQRTKSSTVFSVSLTDNAELEVRDEFFRNLSFLWIDANWVWGEIKGVRNYFRRSRGDF